MAQKLIEVKDLKKYYNGGAVKALDGVTVDICKGMSWRSLIPPAAERVPFSAA